MFPYRVGGEPVSLWPRLLCRISDHGGLEAIPSLGRKCLRVHDCNSRYRCLWRPRCGGLGVGLVCAVGGAVGERGRGAVRHHRNSWVSTTVRGNSACARGPLHPVSRISFAGGSPWCFVRRFIQETRHAAVWRRGGATRDCSRRHSSGEKCACFSTGGSSAKFSFEDEVSSRSQLLWYPLGLSGPSSCPTHSGPYQRRLSWKPLDANVLFLPGNPKAKSIMYDLAAGKRIEHAYIGVHMATITPDFAVQNNRDPSSRFVLPEVGYRGPRSVAADMDADEPLILS